MEAALTKKSPNELIYGKKLRTALEVSMVPLPIPAAAIPLHELRMFAQEEAATAIAITQRAMTKQYDAKRTVLDFSTGYAFLGLGAGYSIPSTRKHKLAQQRMPLQNPWDRRKGQGIHIATSTTLWNPPSDFSRTLGTCSGSRL